MNGIGLSFGNTSACLASIPKNELVVGINVHGNRTTPTTLTNSCGDLAINYDCNFHADNVANLKGLLNGTKQVDVTSLTKSVAFIFNELAQMSYNLLMSKNVSLVMAIPPKSSKRYRKMLTTVIKQAASATGGTIRIKQLVHEPIAALIYYQYVTKEDDRDIFEEDQSVVCFKVGGMFSEVTQVSVVENGLFQIDFYQAFDDCGSDVITQAIFEHFLTLLEKRFKTTFKENEKIKSRLRKEAEICKKTSLKTSTAYKINLESVYNGWDWSQTVSVYSIEAAIKKSTDTVIEPLRAFLEVDASKNENSTVPKVSRIFLYGGGFHLTALQRIIRDQFESRYEIYCDARPDEVIAKGCAVQLKLFEIDDSEVYSPADNSRVIDIKLVRDLQFFANELEIYDLNDRQLSEDGTIIGTETPLLVLTRSSLTTDTFHFAYNKRYDDPIRLEIFERTNNRRYRYEKVVLGEQFYANVSFVKVNKSFAITIQILTHEKL